MVVNDSEPFAQKGLLKSPIHCIDGNKESPIVSLLQPMMEP